jgi:hypothetical protein
MGDEKRKYLRFECLVPVDLIEFGGEGGVEPGGAVIEDISREGLRLILSLGLDLTPGAEVDLKVHAPEEPETCSVSGAIIWSKTKNQKLEVGIKIRKMDDCARNKFLDIGYAKWLESRIAEKKGKKP